MVFCFSQFPVKKIFYFLWNIPSQILFAFTQSLVNDPQRDHGDFVNLMPESQCPLKQSVPEWKIAKTVRLHPGLPDVLYCGLPQRAARSWLECQWCLSHPGNAGHPEPAPGSAGPCTSLESTSSSVSLQWWAGQVWKQLRTQHDCWAFAQAPRFTAESAIKSSLQIHLSWLIWAEINRIWLRQKEVPMSAVNGTEDVIIPFRN